jgi:hypothetical protein
VKGKLFIGRAALVIGSTLSAFLMIEIVLRVFSIPITPPQAAYYWEHWGKTTEEVDKLRRAYNSFAAYDDSIGFITRELLDQERTFDQRKGIRIMFLGDSVTSLKMYTRELEKDIRESRPSTALDFLNAGTGGWNTFNERIYLEKYGLKYHPNIVVLQFHLNDFFSTPVVIRQPDGSWLAFNAGKMGFYLNNSLLSSSRLAQFVFFRLLEWRNNTQSEMAPEIVESELGKIRDMAKANGFALKIVLFPYFRATTDYDRQCTNKIRKIIHHLGLEDDTVDLIKSFSGLDLSVHQLSPGDESHPDESAAKLAADTALPSVLSALGTQKQ